MDEKIGSVSAEIDALVDEGKELLDNTANSRTIIKASMKRDDQKKEAVLEQMEAYQSWYTRALRIVEDIIPHRAEEFRHLYRNDGAVVDHQKGHFNMRNYSISDYQSGYIPKPPMERFGILEKSDCLGSYLNNMYTQISILEAASSFLKSRAGDIKGLLLQDILKEQVRGAEMEYGKGRNRVSMEILLSVTRSSLRHIIRREGNEWKEDDLLRDLIERCRHLNLNDRRALGRMRSMESIRSRSASRDPSNDEMELAFENIEIIIGLV